MRILVAPDKFKGTLSAADVAAALAAGVHAAGGEAVEVPIADGGEGTASILLLQRGGRWIEADTVDARGRPVTGRFALLGDGATAVVEVAEASGLWRLGADELDAAAASTYGTGLLVAAAAEAGASIVIVAAGGSATTDGGEGASEALGKLDVVPELVVACDTRVVFEDAARVYGPQKGADPATVQALERRLHELADTLPRDPRGLPMTGAAGGLAGGLWARFGARLVGGAGLVLDALDIDEHLRTVDAVFTGEGRIDGQTGTGKAVGELAARCVRAGVPCHAFVGRNALTPDEQATLGIAMVVEAGTLDSLAEAGAATVRSQ